MKSSATPDQNYPQLALAYLQAGQLESTRDICKTALKINPQWTEIYEILAKVFQLEKKWDAAYRTYLKVLELTPNSAAIYVNLGHLSLQQGQIQNAMASYQKAIEVNSQYLPAYWQLGTVFYQQGQVSQGLQIWEQGLANNRGVPGDELLNLGVRFQQQKQDQAAIFFYQKALEKNPNFAEAYCNLGAILTDKNEFIQAIKYYHQAIALKSDFAQAHYNLAMVLTKLDRWLEAIQHYETAIKINPNYIKAYYNLGYAWGRQEHWQEAKSYFKQTLNLNPNHAGAYYNLGLIEFKQNQIIPAIQFFQKAIDLNPEYAEAYYNLGIALMKQEKFQDAIVAYEKAIQIKPDYAEAYGNIGIALQRQGGELKEPQLNKMFDSFKQALQIKPELPEIHDSLLNIFKSSWTTNFEPLREMVDFYLNICSREFKMSAISSFIMVYLKSGLSEICYQKLLEIENLVLNHKETLTKRDLKTLYSDLLFSIFYLRDDIKANLGLADQISQGYFTQHLELFPPKDFALTPRKKSKSSELKIGIISHHFRRHSVAWCGLDVIQALSKLTPHLYLYATGTLKPDDKTEQFKAIAHKFYLPELSRDQFPAPSVLIEEIDQDQLDILLDLDSLTVPNHSEILAAKPAPLCISWLGYEAPFISEQNYFLCDWHTHPPGTEQYYREKLLRMPHCFMAVSGFAADFSQVNQFQNVIGTDQPSEDSVVYLCVAPAHKFNPELIEAQVRILQGVPGSILLRKGQGDVMVLQSLYQQECDRQNVDFKRIKFLERTETEEQHRCIYSLVDIVLDSYPYHGGTHTLEALWFNVPLVSRVGEQFLSRMGYSCLKTLGINMGIATSWQEYIDWGTQLGQSQELRQQIKHQLIQSKQPETLSPLWNPEQFAQELYQILQNCSTLK